MRENVERHIQEHEHGSVQPPAPSKASGREMEREVDGGLFAPGALGTKSQLIGGTVGTVAGTLLGALIGLVLGLVFFSGETASVVITVVVGAVAGATALGIGGGFVWNRGAQERGEADV